jgi:hypothetical protein
MIISDKLGTTSRKAVVTYFNLLLQNFPKQMKENHRKSSGRQISSSRFSIGISRKETELLTTTSWRSVDDCGSSSVNQVTGYGLECHG